MLTNKKTSIRLFALVLALLMTVAVFAGCKDQKALDEAAQAKKDAENAQKAAEEAKKAADSLAEAAKTLAEQLEAAQKAAEQAKKDAEQAQKDANAAQSSVDHFHDGTTAPAETQKPIIEDEFGQTTDKVSEKALKQFTELKNRFLITREDWYTADNYVALSKIFEEASYELYRLTTADGVDQLIADTETKANAVPNIVSDAAKVQALIDAFGDVPATLFTTDSAKVEAARAAFDKWVNDYATRFFAKNGFVFVTDAKNNIEVSKTGERKIVDFARKLTNNQVYINVNENTNSLLYAEAKIAALLSYAKDAIYNEMVAQLMISNGKTEAEAKAIADVLFDENATSVEMNKALEQYNVVKKLVEKTAPTYAECKTNANLIEECYNEYKIFFNANGGDDTPISKDDGKGNVLLTGEQFVKLYVLCLYDGELTDYENLVFDYVNNQIIPMFMNVNDKLAISDGTPVVGYDSNDYLTILKTDGSNVITFSVEPDRINIYANGSVVDYVLADGNKIERDFKRVVGIANAKVLALDYSTDFKGKKSLADAYTEIGQIITQAIVDLTQVYYDDVISVAYGYTFNGYEETLKDMYANNNGTAVTSYTKKASRYADSAYYKADNDFYLQASALVDAAIKQAKSFQLKTYEDLNKIEDKKNNIKNISEQKLFEVTNDANGCISGITLYTGAKDAALDTILDAFYKSLNDSYLGYKREEFKVERATVVHETAVNYAMKLDDLVGIAKDNDASKGFDVASKLLADFGDSYKAVIGADNYKVNTVYQSIKAARDTARAEILSIKLLNDDGSYAIDKETYAAKDSKGKAWYTENKDLSGAFVMTTESKNNVAVQVVVDPWIVAEHIAINKFAAGADAVVLKFCDAIRATIKTSLNSDLEFYGSKYFGDLDHVKLEADMKAYIDYLTTLTEFAGVGSNFKTASFSLKDQALDKNATGTKVVTKKNGSNYSYVLHVDTMAKNVAEITGLDGLTDPTNDKAWYYMTNGNLTTFFSIKTGSVVSDGLKLVKDLSYKKDYLRNGDSAVVVKLNSNDYQPISVVYAKYTGTVKDGKFVVAPDPAYVLGTQRTALYLSNLAKVKDAIVAKITAVNLLDSGVKSGKTPAEAYAAAITSLENIMKQADNKASDGLKSDKSLDDYSFYIAWARYYTDDPALAYDWSKYKG